MDKMDKLMDNDVAAMFDKLHPEDQAFINGYCQAIVDGANPELVLDLIEPEAIPTVANLEREIIEYAIHQNKQHLQRIMEAFVVDMFESTGQVLPD